MKIRKRYVLLAVVILAFLVLKFTGPRPGHVLDEAKQAGRTAASLNPIDQVDPAHDFFHDMDPGVKLETKSEINGRIMWLVWTGGNDRFWNKLATMSFGNVDLLKTISSYDPDQDPTVDAEKKAELKATYKSTRAHRFEYLGAVNEPCFEQAPGPDPNRFGLWLDRRMAGCAPDPFEDEKKYPGVQVGARGRNMPVGSYYGMATGIVGLRLFPNPDFDEAAAKRWDPVRFYKDPKYYKSKDLIRPYRVGMACGFCHIGPDPNHSPADPENPKWENLNSTIGGQYLWIDRVFSWESNPDNFIVQLFHSWRPGTVDPSYVSQDNINNPRTINAVFNLPARLELAKKFGREKLGPDNEASLQLNNFVPADSPMAAFFQPPDTVYTMHVLKDASDSIGIIAGLNRVYVNIGLFSEEWLLHFKPLTGGKRITPIEVPVMRKNSVYWQATEAQTYDMAAFLMKAGKPNLLRDVNPNEIPAAFKDNTSTDPGKQIFAERCLRCHSSKLPDMQAGANPGDCSTDYLQCWNKYWHWTQTDDFKAKARQIVAQPDFQENNYLSTDFRVPVTLLQTNACSPLATNAIEGNVWDNFSSATYKSLPAVGKITWYQPFTGEKRTYDMPGGGRGYTRPASLVSLWATAPYLQNNSVGPFDPNPSVEARLNAFQASIEQMLWPERREKDALLGDKIPGKIDRTDQPSYLRIVSGYLPGALDSLLGPGSKMFPGVFSTQEPLPGIVVGPFPSGMPVDLLANLQLALDSGSTMDGLRLDGDLYKAIMKLGSALREARGKSDAEARAIVFRPDVVEPLLKLSKCPDYIVNRGHYFGSEGVEGEVPLTDAEKMALIAYLKTL